MTFSTRLAKCLEIGANLHPIEWAIAYLTPLLLYLGGGPTDDALRFMLFNAAAQLLLFVPVVQIPAYIYGRLTYVDIGWPSGLLLMGLNGYVLAPQIGPGWWPRRVAVSTCYFLHGLRMTAGALFLFGKKTNFTYVFKEDLPRYQYAKVRWEKDMPSSLWWYKIQHDTLQQCTANCAFLVCPLALALFDREKGFGALELLGYATWALSWAFENLADFQKLAYLDDSKRRSRDPSLPAAEAKALRLSVLGHRPFDGPKYWLWTRCRHPNYFFEWMAWVGLVAAAAPSLARAFSAALYPNNYRRSGFGFSARLLGALGRCGPAALGMYICLRFFYDCLLHWTGAGPAEHFSVRKRPLYREYQRATRCFFPLEVPLVDHHRRPGWPDDSEGAAAAGAAAGTTAGVGSGSDRKHKGD